MKRLLCLLVCLVLMLGLLPAAAGAASTELDEVSISGLDHPVMGEKLDTTYKLPARGAKYDKDDDYDEVVWYDLGTSDKETKTALKEGAKAEEGHSYLAELHLVADNKYSFRVRSVEVDLSEEMLCRVQDTETKVYTSSSENDGLTVLLYYEADYLYDRKNPVKLTFEEGADGTVQVGDYPWNTSRTRWRSWRRC